MRMFGINQGGEAAFFDRAGKLVGQYRASGEVHDPKSTATYSQTPPGSGPPSFATPGPPVGDPQRDATLRLIQGRPGYSGRRSDAGDASIAIRGTLRLTGDVGATP